jgi:uncharacterized protein YndB with AHSA1/START domain
MTKRSTTHATFVIEREYPHPPAKVFAAFADPKKKPNGSAVPDDWEVKSPAGFPRRRQAT